MTEGKYAPGTLRHDRQIRVIWEDLPTFAGKPQGSREIACDVEEEYGPLFAAAPELVKALEAIAIALKEPAGGEYWTARKFLDEHNVWHGDIDGERVLLAVAEAALTAAKGGKG